MKLKKRIKSTLTVEEYAQYKELKKYKFKLSTYDCDCIDKKKFKKMIKGLYETFEGETSGVFLRYIDIKEGRELRVYHKGIDLITKPKLFRRVKNDKDSN